MLFLGPKELFLKEFPFFLKTIVFSYNLLRGQFLHSMLIFNSFLKLSTGSSIDIPFKRTNCLPQIPSMSVGSLAHVVLCWFSLYSMYVLSCFVHACINYFCDSSTYFCLYEIQNFTFLLFRREREQMQNLEVFCTDAIHKTFPGFKSATWNVQLYTVQPQPLWKLCS